MEHAPDFGLPEERIVPDDTDRLERSNSMHTVHTVQEKKANASACQYT